MTTEGSGTGMSETKFTPGPWVFHEPYAGFSKITDADDNLIFGIAAGDLDERQTEDVCEANARLIAAAPDLYSALRNAVAKIGRYMEQCGATEAQIHNHTKAYKRLLARARGEA